MRSRYKLATHTIGSLQAKHISVNFCQCLSKGGWRGPSSFGAEFALMWLVECVCYSFTFDCISPSVLWDKHYLGPWSISSVALSTIPSRSQTSRALRRVWESAIYKFVECASIEAASNQIAELVLFYIARRGRVTLRNPIAVIHVMHS